MDNVDKLKVAELRTELESRGLDTKGTKPILVKRLKEFMAANPEAPAPAEEEAAPAAAAAEEAPEPVEEAAVEEAAAEEAVAEEAAAEPEAEGEDEPALANAKEGGEDEPALAAAPENGEKKEGDGDAKTAGKTPLRGKKRKLNDDEPFVVTENEPEIDESVVCLDWYDSDLSMRIDKEEHMGGEPFNREGWGYVWSGARATFGYTTGKVGFEVKLLDNLESKLEGEKRLHELRVGFSTNDTSMQLGEDETSWAYAGNGMAASANNFEEYGAGFAKDDVVGAYVDLTADPVTITFTKNGEDQGQAFSIPKSQLADKALFPHISSRNVKFESNFGKKKDGSAKDNWFAVMEGYEMAANAADGVRNTPRIAKRDECEMIMLIGLPGCGKTTWVNKFIEEQGDKKYDVIGTATLIEKMKVDGEPKKKHLEGKWDQLIQKSTRCLQDWLRTASQRRRNVIIDQTNVYPNAQKRKVRPFEGMTRKAVVIVPKEDDYKARIEAQEKEETKDVPDNAVMEMKANFGLPAEGDDSPFKEITFVELDREEATKLIEEYNKDAKEKGFGKNQNPNKRNKMRGMNRGRGGRGGMNMRGFPPMRGMMMRGRGGPMPMMRGGPMRGMMRGGMPPMGMRGGPMMGGGRGGMMGMGMGGPMMGGRGNMGQMNRGMNRGNRGGAMNRGGGQQKPFQNKQQQRGGGGNRGGNNQRGGFNQQRGGGGGNWKMGGGMGGGPPAKFPKMQMGGGQQAWGGNQMGGMQQGGWGGAGNQMGGGMQQQAWGGMQQGMQQQGMGMGMQQGMGQWGNQGGQMRQQQAQGGWGGQQNRQQGGWGGQQGGYPGSQNWGGYGGR